MDPNTNCKRTNKHKNVNSRLLVKENSGFLCGSLFHVTVLATVYGMMQEYRGLLLKVFAKLVIVSEVIRDGELPHGVCALLYQKSEILMNF